MNELKRGKYYPLRHKFMRFNKAPNDWLKVVDTKKDHVIGWVYSNDLKLRSPWIGQVDGVCVDEHLDVQDVDWSNNV